MKNKRKLDNIVVVGGGTAGWMTALYLQKSLPKAKITVIESEEIGILGAGEGTTPHFISFLDFVNIPVSKLVKEASATIKNGIKFTNWRNNKDYYYHSFLAFDNLGFSGCNVNKKYLSTDAALVLSWANKESLNSIDFISKVSEKNKVPFIYNNGYTNVNDPILKFDCYGNFSVHFNASKLAKCFSTIAIDRGVNRVEGIVTDFKENSYGEISEILVNNKIIKSDFVFDCSGFSRLIIGNYYKSSWKSHKDLLPVDSAIPFFLPIDNKNIPAYTESIAMKYGWIWKIPTSDRFGCGYVYDSSFISEEEAVKEIEEYLGFQPEYPRKNKGGFKFKAGYYEEPWIKNCISVGLSSGFIEPLEATSIWVGVSYLQFVLSNPEILMYRDKFHADQFNDRCKTLNDNVVDFVYFHYMSDRSDTDFWKKFKDIEKAPEYVKYLINSWSKRMPQIDDHTTKTNWAMDSWTSVGTGIGKANSDLAKDVIDNNMSLGISSMLYEEYKSKQDFISSSCTDHSLFLKELGK